MKTVRYLMVDLVIFITVIGTVFVLYQNYSERVIDFFFGQPKVGIFLRDIPLSVSIATTPEEKMKGLSGVESLPASEGELFVFDQEGYYGFWMKDMLIPIDIIWINNAGQVVHVEENVKPESYPTIYQSPQPARFVLETNAFFTSTFKIGAGDKVTIPAHVLPEDLRH